MAGLPGITATLPLLALALAVPAGALAEERSGSPVPGATPAAAPSLAQATPAEPAADPAPAGTPAPAAEAPAADPPSGEAPAATPAPSGADAAPAEGGFPMPSSTPPAGETPPAAAPGAGPGALTPADPNEPRVLISEVVIQGLENHPERERLELAAYAAMATQPGTQVTRSELQTTSPPSTPAAGSRMCASSPSMGPWGCGWWCWSPPIRCSRR